MAESERCCHGITIARERWCPQCLEWSASTIAVYEITAYSVGLVSTWEVCMTATCGLCVPVEEHQK